MRISRVRRSPSVGSDDLTADRLAFESVSREVVGVRNVAVGGPLCVRANIDQHGAVGDGGDHSPMGTPG
jgi:hypothetical protein